MKRFKVKYLWNRVMVCDFSFSAKNLKEANKEAKDFCECKQRVRGIPCELIEVT